MFPTFGARGRVSIRVVRGRRGLGQPTGPTGFDYLRCISGCAGGADAPCIANCQAQNAAYPGPAASAPAPVVSMPVAARAPINRIAATSRFNRQARAVLPQLPFGTAVAAPHVAPGVLAQQNLANAPVAGPGLSPSTAAYLQSQLAARAQATLSHGGADLGRYPNLAAAVADWRPFLAAQGWTYVSGNPAQDHTFTIVATGPSAVPGLDEYSAEFATSDPHVTPSFYKPPAWA